MVDIAKAVQSLIEREAGRREHGERCCRHAQAQLATDNQHQRWREQESQYGDVVQDRDRSVGQVKREARAYHETQHPVVGPGPDDQAALGDVHFRIELKESRRIGGSVQDAPCVIERIRAIGDVATIDERR